MVSFRAVLRDSGEEMEPFGPHPVGHMVLADTGRVMFLFMAPQASEPESEFERAQLFDRMTAYTGWVRADGPDRFVTTVDVAWHPGFLGEQLRMYELDGDLLRVWTQEQTHPRFDNQVIVMEAVWTREDGPANSGGNQVGETASRECAT